MARVKRGVMVRKRHHKLLKEARGYQGSYETVKRFVRTVCERYRLPYFTVTPTFSVCGEHGYLAGEHPTCPRCGAAAEVYSRIVGYLRPLQQWNAGKQAEFERRLSLRPGDAAEVPA